MSSIRAKKISGLLVMKTVRRVQALKMLTVRISPFGVKTALLLRESEKRFPSR